MVYTTLLNDKKHNDEMTRLESDKFGFDYNKNEALNRLRLSWLGEWGSNPRPTGYSLLFLSKKTGLFHHPCKKLDQVESITGAERFESVSTNPTPTKGIVSEPSDCF